MLRSVALPVLLFGLSSQAHAGTPVLQTQNGAVVHWSKPIVEIGLDPRFASRRIPLEKSKACLKEIITEWNQTKSGQPQFYYRENGPFDINVRFCRTRWQGGAIDLGHSQFTAEPKTGVVQAAIIEINECDHAFFATAEASHGRNSLVSVLAHELGHTLGLGHSNDPNSIMFPTGGGVRMRNPNVDDTSALAVIYLGRFPRQDIAPTVAGRPPVPAPSKPAQEPLPTNATALLTVKAKDGRELVVYTSEASVLPPFGTDGNAGGSKRTAKKRKR